MKNLTPEHLRCWAGGGCPAVYESDDGSVAIIGKKATPEQLAEIGVAVGDDEHAIVVSVDLLANVVPSAASHKTAHEEPDSLANVIHT